MTDDEHAYWTQCWQKALFNMPRRYSTGNWKQGSPMVLRMLLGYKTKTDDGKMMSASQHVKTAMNRGDRPRKPEQQELLKMLAGPNGPTLAKAIAIKRGIDLSPWRYWP